MLNPWVEKQLNRCSAPIVYNEDGSIYIPCQGILHPTIGKYYIIRLADYIVNPYEGFDLHQKWNNNNPPPKDKVMEVGIKQATQGMYYIFGVGYDLDNKSEILYNKWEGWVPKKSIEFLREVV